MELWVNFFQCAVNFIQILREKVKKYVLSIFIDRQTADEVSKLLNDAKPLSDDHEMDDIRKGGDDDNLIYKKLYTKSDHHDLTAEVANEISMQSAAHGLAPEHVPNILHAYFEDNLRSDGNIWIVMESAKVPCAIHS